jgi:hypothetical protein
MPAKSQCHRHGALTFPSLHGFGDESIEIVFLDIIIPGTSRQDEDG